MVWAMIQDRGINLNSLDKWIKIKRTNNYSEESSNITKKNRVNDQILKYALLNITNIAIESFFPTFLINLGISSGNGGFNIKKWASINKFYKKFENQTNKKK